MNRDKQSHLGVSSLWVASAIALFAAVGCSSTEARTQVMVEVDADADVRELVQRLTVEIQSVNDGVNVADSTITKKAFGDGEPEPLVWPSTIALVPKNADLSRRYDITAAVFDKNGEQIGVLRVESGFKRHKTLLLKMRFEASCLYEKSLKCPAEETCEKGGCVPKLVDPDSLSTLGKDTPEVIVPDSGTAGSGSKTNANTKAGSGGSSGSGGSTTAGKSGSGASGASAGSGGSGIPVGDPTKPANCGDGMITSDEKCDIAIGEGQPGACPKQCGAATACEPTQLEGDGCQARCQPYTITARDSGDGCCPEGADQNSDTDCGSQCGNGQVEGGESCDPPDTCPTEESCKSADVCLKAFINGNKNECQAWCIMMPIDQCASGDGCCPSGCDASNDSDCAPAPGCGDGVVGAGERCDKASSDHACPTNQASCNDNNACTTDFITGNADNCSSLCVHVPIYLPLNNDGCCPSAQVPVIGNVVAQVANANNDNDCQPMCGNGVVERGERCDGASCPASNAACDDGNACTRDAITGSDCQRACTHTAITNPANGDGCCPGRANATNDNDCDPVCGNQVTESGEDCDPPGRPCASPRDDGDVCTVDAQANACTNPTHTPIPASGAASDGVCCPKGGIFKDDRDCPGCGNGKKEGTEACDGTDGVTPPDTCSAACTIVKPPTMTCGNTRIEGTEECDDGPAGSPSCTPGCKRIAQPGQVCGNGKKEGTESCDGTDGVTPPDTCSANCTIIRGSTMMCGNGKKEGTEACDGTDGVTPPDTCSASCTIVRGSTMMCGNGKKEGTEACDGTDGVTPPDTCSATCTVVKGPTMTCGNGKKEGTEACDGTDGVTPPDTCSALCTIVKAPTMECGNGKKEGTEACDGTEGVTPPDTCSAVCTIVKAPAARCGDNEVNQPSEECDPPNGTTCSANCKIVTPDPTPGTMNGNGNGMGNGNGNGNGNGMGGEGNPGNGAGP